MVLGVRPEESGSRDGHVGDSLCDLNLCGHVLRRDLRESVGGVRSLSVEVNTKNDGGAAYGTSLWLYSNNHARNNPYLIFRICFIATRRSIRPFTPSERSRIFIFVLAVADLVVLMTIPFSLAQILQKKWSFGSLVCASRNLVHSFFTFRLAMQTSCVDRVEWEILLGHHPNGDEHGKVSGGLHQVEVHDLQG